MNVRVRITIEPEWDTPADSMREQMLRDQSKWRMESFADSLAIWIQYTLNRLTASEWVDVSERLRRALMDSWR